MANTVTYTYPVAGVTPPTAAEARDVNMLMATITGDNSATSFVVTHNWNISSADRTKGFPLVAVELLAAAGGAALAFAASQTADAITFTNVAFSGALIRIRLQRPYSMIR